MGHNCTSQCVNDTLARTLRQDARLASSSPCYAARNQQKLHFSIHIRPARIVFLTGAVRTSPRPCGRGNPGQCPARPTCQALCVVGLRSGRSAEAPSAIAGTMPPSPADRTENRPEVLPIGPCGRPPRANEAPAAKARLLLPSVSQDDAGAWSILPSKETLTIEVPHARHAPSQKAGESRCAGAGVSVL